MLVQRRPWLLAVWAICIVQIAAACDNGSTSATEQAPKDDRTVILSVVFTKSGVLREVEALSGPTALRPAAIEAARRQK